MSINLLQVPKREAAERTRQLQYHYLWLAGEAKSQAVEDEALLVLVGTFEALAERLRREEES